jgi:hypothetical protein
VLPGGSSPRPPFSRFARRAAIGSPYEGSSEASPGGLGGSPQERRLVQLTRRSSCFLGGPPPDPRFLASLGALPLASPYEGPSEPGGSRGSPQERRLVQLNLRDVHRASWGIHPQTPVFSLRSACCHWQVHTKARAKRARGVWFPPGKKVRPTYATFIVLPGGSSPRPPFPRFARCTAIGKSIRRPERSEPRGVWGVSPQDNSILHHN